MKKWDKKPVKRKLIIHSLRRTALSIDVKRTNEREKRVRGLALKSSRPSTVGGSRVQNTIQPTPPASPRPRRWTISPHCHTGALHAPQGLQRAADMLGFVGLCSILAAVARKAQRVGPLIMKRDADSSTMKLQKQHTTRRNNAQHAVQGDCRA